MSCPHDGNVSKRNAVEIKTQNIIKYEMICIYIKQSYDTGAKGQRN